MFLKSLELVGFKSFAKKTVLEFPTGITAIVGPNGSGKSNIIDSIRWLLGEREAKNLRSAKAEDLIFKGTPILPRISIAQASLHFDNNSGFFPIDFREVLIVRRVGRDGLSQYFINKTETRLKEIIDFFSRSRLGAKGLAIINQGEADLFIRSTSEERRAMIEEILGLREYQFKKSEAERKLKNASLNLEKVGVMIEEVLPHLKTLKRQTNKWIKRAEIEKELRELEDRYFSYKLEELKQAQNEIEPLLNSLEQQIKGKYQELKILEVDLKKTEAPPAVLDIKQIKEKQRRLLIERSQIEKELGRLETKLEFLAKDAETSQVFRNEDLLNFIKEIKKILEKSLNDSDFEKLKKIVGELLAKLNIFLKPAKSDNLSSTQLLELKDLKKELERKINDFEKELRKLEEEEIKTACDLEEFNKNFQKTFGLVEIKQRESRKLEEERNKIIFEKEKSALKFGDLKNQLEQIDRRIEEFQISGTVLSEIELSDMERRMFKLRTELAAIGEIDESLVKEAKEVEAHYNFLANQSDDLKKAVVDLDSLIKELSAKINSDFASSLKLINEEFNKFFRLMFGGGQAKLRIKNRESRIKREENRDEKDDNEIIEKNGESDGKEVSAGVEIDLNLPKKRATSLELLSGGERSLVSIAALFALISISPPPFLVLDEIDAALDENNSKRFADLVKEFSKKTQFIIVTHNRAVMEAADILYGITIGEDGTSKALSLKLES